MRAWNYLFRINAKCACADFFITPSEEINLIVSTPCKSYDSLCSLLFLSRGASKAKIVSDLLMMLYILLHRRPGNSILCYKEGKSTIPPDFRWKGRIRMRAMVRAQWTIFNQLTHNYVKYDGVLVIKKLWKNNFVKKYFKTKIYDTINQCDTIFVLLAPLDRGRERTVSNIFYRE